MKPKTKLYLISDTDPAPPEVLEQMAARKAEGHKLILGQTNRQRVGSIIPAHVFGVPMRVIRESTREEYARESPEGTADGMKSKYFYELDAVD